MKMESLKIPEVIIVDAGSQPTMEKTSLYVRTVVGLHNVRDRVKETVDSFQEQTVADRLHNGWNNTKRSVNVSAKNFFAHPENVPSQYIPSKYDYIFRRKSRWELVLLGGTVCGIEFCYAAETAFVTPILLSLGLNIKFVTMIWCLSPLIGFFLTPILGSLSDSCESCLGRRRPFILLYSIGILIGLTLVPNGRRIGVALGDESSSGTELIRRNYTTFLEDPYNLNDENLTHVQYNNLSDFNNEYSSVTNKNTNETFKENSGAHKSLNDLPLDHGDLNNLLDSKYRLINREDGHKLPFNVSSYKRRRKRFAGKRLSTTDEVFGFGNKTDTSIKAWSITFTVIGTVLLDFCSDACQSPSRTYMLDVSVPSDHAGGLSTFTLMAGLGGSIGYLMGAVHWEATFLGNWLGGQVNAVFAIVTIVFIICLISTVCSFPEIPLLFLSDPKVVEEYQRKLQIGMQSEISNEKILLECKKPQYGSTEQNVVCNVTEEFAESSLSTDETSQNVQLENGIKELPKSTSQEKDHVVVDPAGVSEHPTLKEYLRSIFRMPKSLRILCLTNLFCWMSLVCYSLYFTDFVAECVFGGDPRAPEESKEYILYKDGVRFGCWGMALYSLACSFYSYFIEAMVNKLGAKTVYIGGQLIYSVGMVIMAMTRHPVAVILLSPTAGVMYSTLFTMPYLLIAHYHTTQQFRDDSKQGNLGIRGMGTDIAAVSSMVFLSQFILSLSMGSIVEAVGSNVATVCAAALLSTCGAISATQVMYLDV